MREAEEQDYVDFKLKIEDHGDERITITIYLSEKKADFIESK